MKKLAAIIVTILSVISCTNLDDILEQLRDHEQRIQKLEALCTQLNSNVEAIQTILAVLEQNDYITDITKITEAGIEIGYSITFAKGGTINIYHGSNGSDAPAPKSASEKPPTANTTGHLTTNGSPTNKVTRFLHLFQTTRTANISPLFSEWLKIYGTSHMTTATPGKR